MNEAILSRIITPIAHWIDYLFHVNCYLVARFLFQGSLLSTVVFMGDAVTGGSNPIIIFVAVLIAAIFILACIGAIKHMTQASREYENNPASWPKVAATYVAAAQGSPSPLMLGSIQFALGITLAIAAGNPIRFLESAFLLLHALGNLFAAVPPPGRPRREAKRGLVAAAGAA